MITKGKKADDNKWTKQWQANPKLIITPPKEQLDKEQEKLYRLEQARSLEPAQLEAIPQIHWIYVFSVQVLERGHGSFEKGEKKFWQIKSQTTFFPAFRSFENTFWQIKS